MNMKYFNSIFSLQWLLLIFILFSASATAGTTTKFKHINQRHTVFTKMYNRERVSPANAATKYWKTFFYKQTLDHFSYTPFGYSTFQQQYVMYYRYWAGAKAKAPIFAFLGSEAPLDDLIGYEIGFTVDLAHRFKGLVVFLEHRFYGKSVPFGSFEKALTNLTIAGYFNSAQALADYAAILLSLKKKHKAKDCPVIVVGGSYGGELAAWFRLKYPHVALGALASSAPVLYYDDITPTDSFYKVVAKTYRDTSETCLKTIADSWAEIDKVASQPKGLSILSKKFKTCNPLDDVDTLKNYLKDMYAKSAQYDAPSNYPVSQICRKIDGIKSNDILGKISAGVVAYSQVSEGSPSCYVNPTQQGDEIDETTLGWQWQSCTEFTVITEDIRDDNPMFPPDPQYLTDYLMNCFMTNGGVVPRPHWITTYYGGHDIKLILRRFGSNIIFSNGLRDPWSAGGVLQDISDTIVAIYTKKGSHCLDLAAENRSSDPSWLTKQHDAETKVIAGWLTKYYADLKALK